ncbi:hypothetical protein BSN82_18215, partial [Acinetobacter baylyi]|uniref:hypothetical protein n=1 Tax=Acinetobacter baylyi TaxID=202950 RepID=UPI003EBF78FA
VNSKKYNVRYEVLSLGDLIGSHSPKGDRNVIFPPELQGRARSRAEYPTDLINKTQHFQPIKLGRNPQADSGA